VYVVCLLCALVSSCEQFVKYEFKLHKEAKEEFVNDFLKQWRDYRNELAGRRTVGYS